MDLGRRLRNRLKRVPLVANGVRQARRRANVMMVHVGRSGSTVLADLLRQHPGVGWDGEIYQSVFRQRARPDHTLPDLSDLDPVAFLLERSRQRFCRYYGFEVKFFHVRAFGWSFRDFLAETESRMGRLRVVVLRRRNLLRKVVSSVVARQTGVTHSRVAAQSPVPVRIQPEGVFVDRETRPLIELLRQAEADFLELDGILGDIPSVALAYEEDILADPRTAYRKVCAFIGEKPREVEVRFERTQPWPLAESIGNYQEVCAALRGTDFEWMLATESESRDH